ncbi:MAG: Alpha/beta hydrolase family protein [bacterium ADurb.Bin212]|nr:MAG: Alpha/beta hydrolase family protein [bacterium ADurb.Bin212]
MNKTAILLPGFLDSKDYAHLVDLDNKLSILGYSVVRINPTGTWEGDGDASKYSITSYLADVDNEINKHQNYQEILLAGHSLGGSIALLYASRNPSVTTAVGIMCPTTYIRDENMAKINSWRERGYKISNRDLPQNPKKQREFTLPFSFIEDSMQYDVTLEISKLKGRLILIAGEVDDCVAPKQLKDIYDVANYPKELIVMSGIGHDYRHNQDETEKVNQTIINCLQ